MRRHRLVHVVLRHGYHHTMPFKLHSPNVSFILGVSVEFGVERVGVILVTFVIHLFNCLERCEPVATGKLLILLMENFEKGTNSSRFIEFRGNFELIDEST